MSKKGILFWLFVILLFTAIPVIEAEESKIERTTVNGMNILLQKTNLGLVEISLLLKSGSGLDPTGKKGTAFIMNNLVMLSLRYSKVELGDVRVETYPDYTLISIKTSPATAQKVLGEIKNLLSYPLYSYDVITDLKGLFSTDIKGIPALAKAYYDFTKDFYGLEHPYNDQLNAEVVGSIRGSDVYKWYRQTYQPGNAILSISGGFNRSIGELEKFFARMRSEKVDRRLLIQPVQLQKDQEKTEVDPNGRAASIVIGYPAPRIQDPDYPAFRVIAYYLSEYQHYFEELRVKEGLFYSEFVYYNFLEKPKAPNIVFATMTTPESLDTVAQKTLEITDRLVTKGIEQTEIQKIIKAMKAESAAKKVSGKGMASLNALSHYFQTQLIYDDILWPKIDQVKTDDIKNAAAKYFKYSIKVAYIPKDMAEEI